MIKGSLTILHIFRSGLYFLPDWLRRVYFFNQFERDKWIKIQANNVPPGSRVLDVGAGSCPYRFLFAHCEYKTHDFAQLSSNQLRGQRGYGAIDYLSDVLTIPVPDASFDVILCTEVLEHVPEPILTIQEFKRILKPGGKLIITAPLGSGLHQDPYHFYGGYTPHWYNKFLSESSFERITIEANGGFFKYYGQESIRFCVRTAPWKVSSSLIRLISIPFWLLSLPLFGITLPLLGYILDRFDTQKDFTIGYHVMAIKKSIA